MRTETVEAAKSEVAQAVKRIVYEFDPEAKVILYGSRARGDAEADSDWDFLVLTSGTMSFEEKERLHRRLFDPQLEHAAVFSIQIESKEWWHAQSHTASPFYRNVEREGRIV